MWTDGIDGEDFELLGFWRYRGLQTIACFGILFSSCTLERY